MIERHIDLSLIHIWLHQDAWFSTLDLDKGHDVEYRMHTPGNGAYVFVIEGLVEVDGEVLGRRDGMGVWDTAVSYTHL